MEQIITISQSGIIYVDEKGNTQSLNFEACYRNFLIDLQKRQGEKYLDEHREFYKTWKSVGVRHRSDNLPKIAFYTEPPIVFEFPTEDSFWQVLSEINKAGYRTTDGD